MRLSRRLTIEITVVMLAIGLLIATAMVSLHQLDQKLGRSLQGYQRLRWAYETGLPVVRARDALQSGASDAEVIDRLRAAMLAGYETADPGDVSQHLSDSLRAAMDVMRQGGGQAGRVEAAGYVNRALNVLAGVSSEVRVHIETIEAEAVASQRRAMWTVAATGVAVSILLVWMGLHQYRRIMGPIRGLEAAARALGQRQWQTRVAVVGDEELATLAKGFNTMADDLEGLYHTLEQRVHQRSQQLVRAHRLAGVGLLAAGVAHEINNPLAIIAGQLELMLREVVDESPAQRDDLQSVLDEVFRCKKIIEKLLSLSRPTPPTCQRVSLRGIASVVVESVQGLATRKRCRVEMRAEASCDVWADEMEMRQVVLNLLFNAIDAVAEVDGVVEVVVKEDAGRVMLCVEDNGRGIAADRIDDIFQAFYTEGEHHGHGLGLTVTRAIVGSHGGILSVVSDGVDRGARFIVSLPSIDASVQVAQADHTDAA